MKFELSAPRRDGIAQADRQRVFERFVRTLWYSLYDLTERTVEIDFDLNSQVCPSGDYSETRGDPFKVHRLLAKL